MTTPDTPTGAVLLVDDEDTVRRFLERVLERLGHHVVSASGGQAALAQFEASNAPFHAVLLDLNMPNMSGTETLHKLRAAGCNAPMFIMTGYDEKFLDQDLPIDGYLAKPIDLVKLETLLDR